MSLFWVEDSAVRFVCLAAALSLGIFFALFGVGDLAGYSEALGLTLAIECAVAYALGLRTSRGLAAVALCSLVTHPALHIFLYGFYDFGGGLHAVPVIASELGVVLVEFAILCVLLPERRKSSNAVVALAMNAVSYAAGLMLS